MFEKSECKSITSMGIGKSEIIMNTYESYLKHEAGNIITIEECMDIYSRKNSRA